MPRAWVMASLLLTATAASAQPAPPVDPESYAVRLAELERRIQELKERIWSRPARWPHPVALALLDLRVDTRLAGWQVESVDVRVDGQPLEPPADSWLHWQTASTPGPHDLAVELRLRGDGGPLFPYVKGYVAVLHASTTVTIGTVAGTRLRLVVDQDPDPTVPFERRPRMRLEPELR